MKKWLPWILTGLFGAWLISSVRPKAETGFPAREFGKIPVLLNGRIQPMDSVARNSLLQLRALGNVGLHAFATRGIQPAPFAAQRTAQAARQRLTFRFQLRLQNRRESCACARSAGHNSASAGTGS